ncbi:hypothetical protein [Candidatus Fukatsuia symbiotica]|nr:hypothetical protein [Candidatus Fukatsuia symbiotica]
MIFTIQDNALIIMVNGVKRVFLNSERGYARMSQAYCKSRGRLA